MPAEPNTEKDAGLWRKTRGLIQRWLRLLGQRLIRWGERLGAEPAKSSSGNQPVAARLAIEVVAIDLAGLQGEELQSSIISLPKGAPQRHLAFSLDRMSLMTEEEMSAIGDWPGWGGQALRGASVLRNRSEDRPGSSAAFWQRVFNLKAATSEPEEIATSLLYDRLQALFPESSDNRTRILRQIESFSARPSTNISNPVEPKLEAMQSEASEKSDPVLARMSEQPLHLLPEPLVIGGTTARARGRSGFYGFMIAPFFTAMEKRKSMVAVRDSQVYALEKPLGDMYEQRYGQRPAAIQENKLPMDLPANVPNLAARTGRGEAVLLGTAHTSEGVTWQANTESIFNQPEDAGESFISRDQVVLIEASEDEEGDGMIQRTSQSDDRMIGLEALQLSTAVGSADAAGSSLPLSAVDYFSRSNPVPSKKAVLSRAGEETNVFRHQSWDTMDFAPRLEPKNFLKAVAISIIAQFTLLERAWQELGKVLRRQTLRFLTVERKDTSEIESPAEEAEAKMFKSVSARQEDSYHVRLWLQRAQTLTPDAAPTEQVAAAIRRGGKLCWQDGLDIINARARRHYFVSPSEAMPEQNVTIHVHTQDQLIFQQKAIRAPDGVPQLFESLRLPQQFQLIGAFIAFARDLQLAKVDVQPLIGAQEAALQNRLNQHLEDSLHSGRSLQSFLFEKPKRLVMTTLPETVQQIVDFYTAVNLGNALLADEYGLPTEENGERVWKVRVVLAETEHEWGILHVGEQSRDVRWYPK